MNKWLKNILIILAFFGAIYLLWMVRTTLYYFLAAAAFSLAARPVVTWLTNIQIAKRHMPNWLASILSMLFFLLIFVGVFSLVIPVVAQEARQLSKLNYSQLISDSGQTWQWIEMTLSEWNIDTKSILSEDNIKAYLTELLSVASVKEILNGIAGTFGNGFVALFSILFIAFFLIKDRRILSNIVFSLTPDENTEEMKNIIENSKKLLSRYFIGLFIQITIVAALLAIGLSLFGVEYAFLLAVLAAIFNLIPYIGPIIGASLALLLTLTLNLDAPFYDYTVPQLIKVAGVFAVVQLLDNIVSQPLIFSNSVKAHPLEIFLVISIAGTLGGIGGMIIAIPFYTFLRIVAMEFFSNNKAIRNLTQSIK